MPVILTIGIYIHPPKYLLKGHFHETAVGKTLGLDKGPLSPSEYLNCLLTMGEGATLREIKPRPLLFPGKGLN
jgi:hypothetical protein